MLKRRRIYGGGTYITLIGEILKKNFPQKQDFQSNGTSEGIVSEGIVLFL